MLIGDAAPGVALFLTGLILSAQPFRLDWKVVIATWIADIIRPLLTAAVVFAPAVSRRDRQGRYSACRHAVGVFRHPVRRELSPGLRDDGIDGRRKHRIEHRDDGDRHRRALPALRRLP